MKHEKSLLQYLRQNLDERKHNWQSVNYLIQDNVPFPEYLEDTVILQRSELVDDFIPAPNFRQLTYNESVDLILNYVLKQRMHNVLVWGYKDPSSFSPWSVNAFNPFCNFQVNHLKGSFWEFIFNILGPSRFQNIIYNTDCFVKVSGSNYVQLFGGFGDFSKNSGKVWNKFSFLYKANKMASNDLCIISDDSLGVIAKYFMESEKIFNCPKRFRVLNLLLKKIVNNDKNCKYFSIFRNICLNKSKDYKKSKLLSESRVKDVHRFLLVTIDKVFPQEIWGSKRNKSFVFSRVIAFAGCKLNLENEQGLIENIKLSEIRWIAKSTKSTSQQDLEMRKRILYNFFNWFFQEYVSKLLRSFWYITEAHSNTLEKKFTFVPQDCWKSLFNFWFASYENDFLIEDKRVSFLELSARERFNTGRVRLIPKSNGFRVVCIPYKDFMASDKDNISPMKYHAFLTDVIRPIREIILYKQRLKLNLNKFYPKCYSLEDIISNISAFKLRDNETSRLEKYFIIKFDLEKCFDNLEQLVVLDSINDLFSDEGASSKFYVRQVIESEFDKKHKLKTRFIVKEKSQVGNFDLFKAPPASLSNRIFIDKCKTLTFNKHDIINIVKEQIFNIKLYNPMDGRMFARKRGIFQGFPLSPILCDVCLDYVVYDQFSSFTDQGNCILLRLADDFLFISKSINDFKKFQNIIFSTQLKRFGVNINIAKTTIIDQGDLKADSLSFLGLKINVKNLSLSRGNDTHRSTICLSMYMTHKSSYKYLEDYCKSQLKDYLLNIFLNDVESVVTSIMNVIDITLRSYRKHHNFLKRVDTFSKSLFQKFISNLIFAIEKKLDEVNCILIEEVKYIIHHQIMEKLRLYGFSLELNTQD